MANDEIVNMEWENHNQDIANTFKRLYEDETLTDVTVHCKDGPLRAHKLVLSISSPYFNRIYQMNPGVHMVVMVNGVTMKEMQLLLEFMYKGTVTIPTECYEKVAQLAEQLEMKHFKKLGGQDERKNDFFESLNMAKVNTKQSGQPRQSQVEESKEDKKGKGAASENPEPPKRVQRGEEEAVDTDGSQNEEEVKRKPTKMNLTCKVCKNVFKNTKMLSLHIKTHAKADKKAYTCEFCPSSFKRSSHLTRHKLIHTGEKPFSCSKCDKSFSRLDKLRQHMRNTHHNNTLLTSELLKKKRPLELTGQTSSGKKSNKSRARTTLEIEEVHIKQEEDYDVTNLPYGDLNYLTMSEEEDNFLNAADQQNSDAMGLMEPLVEIKTQGNDRDVKFEEVPRFSVKAGGTLGKIGECIISMTRTT